MTTQSRAGNVRLIFSGKLECQRERRTLLDDEAVEQQEEPAQCTPHNLEEHRKIRTIACGA